MSKRAPQGRVDRTAFSVVPLSQADDDAAYWRARTPHQRLQALEQTRQALYGYTSASGRLQRILEVAQLKVNKQAAGRRKDLLDLDNLP